MTTRIPALYPTIVALVGAVWLHANSVSPDDPDAPSPAFYRTKTKAVLCETPFQIRKGIVAMGQDDGAEIMHLACTRPGADRRARLISAPVTRFGPWQVDLITGEGRTITLWGYADQFEPGEY